MVGSAHIQAAHGRPSLQPVFLDLAIVHTVRSRGWRGDLSWILLASAPRGFVHLESLDSYEPLWWTKCRRMLSLRATHLQADTEGSMVT